MQVSRTGRIRGPPVAFWANQIFRVDKKTGVAEVQNPFEDQLQFGKVPVKAEPGTRSDIPSFPSIVQAGLKKHSMK